MRHLVWAGVIVGTGLLGAAISLAGGSWFWASLSGAVIGLGTGLVWMGWRLEHESDRRMADLIASAYGHSNRNGDERVLVPGDPEFEERHPRDERGQWT